ncbi:hypothetical protein MMC08_001996 [Hypocenomyce scalaris]|nr:hypothetical protein [Hypocenomyce scalaris]
MCLPCCFPFADVYLEDPPTKKEEKKENKKKEEEEKREYMFVNDDAAFYPTHPNQPIYQGQPPLCYPLAAAPAIEQPSAHHVWYGRTKEQVDAENIAIAQKVGTNKPVQLVPYNPSGEQQFWCRELDSSYTLRTSKDITENLQPGFWQYAQPGGYPYWYRMKK